MGMRMSVGPSCARIEPSTNSTMEWMVDWGWMTTWILSRSVPKSHLASITSKPLFMRVAESIVILWPIFQLGWFRACFGVIFGCFWAFFARWGGGGLGGGPATRCQDQAFDFFWFAGAETLVDGVVFG